MFLTSAGLFECPTPLLTAQQAIAGSTGSTSRVVLHQLRSKLHLDSEKLSKKLLDLRNSFRFAPPFAFQTF